MASVSVRCGGLGGGAGGTCFRENRRGGINLRSPAINQVASFNVTTKAMSRGKRDYATIPFAMSVSRTSILETKTARTTIKHKHEQKKSVSYDNLIEKWMKNSVVDIVKNLREAPLLVHVFNDDGNVDAPRLKTEKAVPENWLSVKSKWEDGTAPLPEGVIFVEQLEQEEVESESEEFVGFGGESGTTRAWGIVVQAKGQNCGGPACYLLKTSRVGAGPGLGLGLDLCCTHFCLVKVKSFRVTAEAQFKNCWLLNGN